MGNLVQGTWEVYIIFVIFLKIQNYSKKGHFKK